MTIEKTRDLNDLPFIHSILAKKEDTAKQDPGNIQPTAMKKRRNEETTRQQAASNRQQAASSKQTARDNSFTPTNEHGGTSDSSHILGRKPDRLVHRTNQTTNNQTTGG